jgi:hypothetical protein
MKIWLDDLRDPPDTGWIVARNYEAFEQILRTIYLLTFAGGQIDLISFDHDLGEGKDGYDCIKLCASVDYCEMYPQDIEVHSMNPIGRDNILAFDEWFRRTRDAIFAALDDQE